MANKYVLSVLVLLLLVELIAAGDGWKKVKEVTRKTTKVAVKAPGKIWRKLKERMDGPDWSGFKDNIENRRRAARPSAHGTRD
jgi:hypothetical protein